MTVMRDTVVKSLAKVTVQGDENGLIPEYEVLVNLLPVALLNSFAERIMAAAPPERKAEVEAGLVRAAYECGYHTGCGIITSESFNEAVMPMVTEGAAAWLASTGDEGGFVQAFKAGSNLQIKGTSQRGTNTTDSYSLSGATAAMNAIDAACA